MGYNPLAWFFIKLTSKLLFEPTLPVDETGSYNGDYVIKGRLPRSAFNNQYNLTR